MNSNLSTNEKKLLEHAKSMTAKYNRQRHARGGIDTLYAFALSESGATYDGACFEPNISHATVCGERHAIANMVMNEAYDSKLESIVIADPVPTVQKRGTPPCGTCRHLIWQFGKPSTTVILMQYIQHDGKWTFPAIEKHTIEEFYPLPYEPIEGLWD